MYKKAFAKAVKDEQNTYDIHLWTDDDGYKVERWVNEAYIECSPEESTHKGLNGESLKKTTRWKRDDMNLHFADITPYQKFLIEKYGTNDDPSTSHKELFFDIEIEMGEALTEEYIKSAPKKVTSVAWYDKSTDKWVILILDAKSQIKHTKTKNREIIPFPTEKELLKQFIISFREIDPDIIVGWNSDYFDIPYLYYRIKNVLGQRAATYLSPINVVRETPWFKDQYIQIAGC